MNIKRLASLGIKILLGWIILYCFIGSLVNWTRKMPMYTHLRVNYSHTVRMNFLNNTFCGKIISGTWNKTISADEIKQRQRFLYDRYKHSDIYHNDNISCSDFIANNDFYSKFITDIERDNPIAFTILVYKHFYQFQVLMKTLYVRTNLHCIHIDRKAPQDIYLYVLKLSTCLENVYLVNERIDVKWGDISVLEAERLCQRLLLNRSSAWHYYMTIAGTELPIQTNLNRLQILQLVPDKTRVDVTSSLHPFYIEKSDQSIPPYNMNLYKGELHAILTRNFIRAVHTHSLALQLYAYLNGTIIPDEFFYSSLVRRRDFPGVESRLVESYTYKKLVSHYKIWSGQSPELCQSNQYVRTICQFNYKDLSNIEKSGRLFVNKMNEEYDLVGIDCWEEWFKVKEKYHQDINPGQYIDQYPFTQRTTFIRNSRETTRKNEQLVN